MEPALKHASSKCRLQSTEYAVASHLSLSSHLTYLGFIQDYQREGDLWCNKVTQY